MTEGSATMAGQHDQGEHKHGSMDVTAQERTFAGFMQKVVWGAGIAIALLVFAALVNG
jgi:hypothetical protein